jgi:hypothetical protein
MAEINVQSISDRTVLATTSDNSVVLHGYVNKQNYSPNKTDDTMYGVSSFLTFEVFGDVTVPTTGNALSFTILDSLDLSAFFRSGAVGYIKIPLAFTKVKVTLTYTGTTLTVAFKPTEKLVTPVILTAEKREFSCEVA